MRRGVEQEINVPRKKLSEENLCKTDICSRRQTRQDDAVLTKGRNL